MNSFVKRLLCLAAAVLTPAVLCSCDGRESAQGICYRISGGRNSMVMLGSIHVGSPEMEPYGQHILDAMANADTFVFECNSADPEAAMLSQQLMLSTEGELKARLSPESWQRLENACQEAGLNINGLQKYKPWAVTSMLTTRAAAEQMGARSTKHAASLGVEEIVEKHSKGKEIRYLETASQQLTMMDGFSPALQEALLMQACDAILEPKENTQLANWPQWWHSGNGDTFAEEYLNDHSLPAAMQQEYHAALVTSRNAAMTDALISLLEGEEEHSYFVTVGLMHLVLPDDSILSGLEARGYTVEQLFSPEQ